MLGRAFGNGLAEVFALTHATNQPSQRVCRRLGLRDTGVHPDRWYGGLSQIFHLTRAEWGKAGP